MGTDISGTTAQGNGTFGVYITSGATNNTIGGTTAGAGNLISGGSDGIVIYGAGTTGNLVQGNFIGTDINGSADLGNTQVGVRIIFGASSNTLGGTIAGAGNVISGNDGTGVVVFSPGTAGNFIQGNYIGTDVSGTAALGNGLSGVFVSGGAASNTIGGTTTGARNVISANGSHGINLDGSNGGSTGHFIQGNFIGTDVSGTAALGNSNAGVKIDLGATNNTIGGTTAGARNVISGNDSSGVYIADTGTAGNIVRGNFIGTGATGTTALSNASNGVLIAAAATGNTIGGTTAGARNVISGNGGDGVQLADAGTTGNGVQGNFIGTDATGTTALSNASNGVRIATAATGNTIGGTTPGARNVISGNGGDGVQLADAGTTGNGIQGNHIGTDVSGTTSIANGITGVAIIFGASSNTIGGTTPGAGNLLAGNTNEGIFIGADIGTGTCDDNLVQGNLIGTDVSGTSALPNGRNGVLIQDGATGNSVGGTTAGAANTIAFNTLDGVQLFGATTIENALLGNSLYENGDLGIDLGNDGVTPNDPGDGDASPNKLQNFPEFVLVETDDGGNLLVTYFVDTDPANASYPLRVEFFAADIDQEEGRTLLGHTSYTASDHSSCGSPPCEETVNLGNAAGLGIGVGDSLVATATDDDGNTSEFTSPAISAPVTRYVATTGNDTGNDCTNQANPCATITHAVSQANAGDTIDIAAGTYNEPGLLIDKALNIQGQGVIVQ